MERSLKKKRIDSSEPDLPQLFNLSENDDVDTEDNPGLSNSGSRNPVLSDSELINPVLSDSEFSDPGASAGDSLLTTSTSTKASTSSLRHTGTAMIAVANLHKGYVKAKKMIPVLRGIDMDVAQGEYLSIVGQSGSGKSTLLHLMGTLDVPDQGTIHFDGQRIDHLPSAKRDYLRNHCIGMIFQFYHLIPEMTTLENVLAPIMIRDSIFDYFAHRRTYRQKAEHLLELVGLTHRLKHRPSELSGGEMQRVSIARALVGDPRILLADEPTGNLDSKTSREIIKLLRGLNETQKLTIVMVTHDLPQAQDADRIIRLVDGQIVPE